MVYEFFQESFAETDNVDIVFDIVYAQAQDIIRIEIQSGGREYDPFRAESESDGGDLAHVGVTIVKKRSKQYAYAFEEGKNKIQIEL